MPSSGISAVVVISFGVFIYGFLVSRTSCRFSKRQRTPIDEFTNLFAHGFDRMKVARLDDCALRRYVKRKLIDFASRRVQILGATPNPEALFSCSRSCGR